MFTLTFPRLCGLNALLILALLSQLISGGPNQMVELWCLEMPQPIYRTVARRWTHWLLRSGLLLVLLLWKRTACPPLAWGLLVGPLLEVLCLGLSLLCRTVRWRRRWWLLARGLKRSYGWAVLLLLLVSPLRQDFGEPLDGLGRGLSRAVQDTVSARHTWLLMGGLLVPGRREKAAAPQPEVETAEQAPLYLPVPCHVMEPADASPAGEVLFSGWAPDAGLLQIVRGEETLRFWVGGVVLFELPRSDRAALCCLVHLWVRQERLTPQEAAQVLERSVRTVERDQATYQREQDSACLVDRRCFNLGQRTAYRLEEHVAELIIQWVLNLLNDDPNNGRHLEAQLERMLDDRTIDRALMRLGLSAAEAAGVRQKVQEFVARVRQEAYWAGVEGRPLAEVKPTLPEAEWEQQISDCATLSIATLHLVGNGAYEAAQGLLAKREGLVSAIRAWHTLLTHLVASGGARLSQAKHQIWPSRRGLLGGRLMGTSASFLRQWVVDVAEKAKETFIVQRSDGQEETITRLQAYQEESVAQRVRRGLVTAKAVWLDCYVNGVSRREAIVRAWHGTKHWAVKAFRRNIAQDVETGQAVTCPLSPSDVTPLWVLKQVVDIINGGLDRAGAVYRLGRVTADRWWSVAEVLAYCLDENVGFLCWAKSVKTVVEALDTIEEADPGWQEITREIVDPDSSQVKQQVVGYRLETELAVYDLSKPVRVIVDWDGKPGGRKMMRLALGVTKTTLGTEGVCDELRFRQRVEIVLKFLQRWLQLPNFGGGEAVARADERVCPSDEDALKKLGTERKKTATRLRNARVKLEQVETELAYLTADDESKRQPSNSLGLGVQDLRSLAKRLHGQIERAEAKLQELEALIAWGRDEGPAPEQETQYDLDLTREAILTQLKLDVFTAYQTLVDEFIELALKPVLREEAERQAVERRRLDKRSTAKDREGQPLCTDVETLYHAKVASLERETILERLLNQPGRHLYHSGEHILVTVAQRFSDRRMQAAYERYCYILNQKQIRVPMDEGEDWLLLFTYEKPSSSGDKFK